MEIFLLLLVLLVVASGWYFFLKKKKKQTLAQSSIILEKLKTVCKLVTVEGNFSEIYHYQNNDQSFLNLFGKKKALVVVTARASVGYDLSKLKMHADNRSKKIYLTEFPEPEVLTIDTEFKYYDKKDSVFNRFNAEDLTDLNKEAKRFISEKIPESGLMDNARKEAIEMLSIMESLVQTIGWQLDIEGLAIEQIIAPKKIERKSSTKKEILPIKKSD